MSHLAELSCYDARHALWPPEHPRIHSEAHERAWAHVHACRECSRHFREDLGFREALGDAPWTPAPVEVRESVFRALAGVRSQESTSAARPVPPRGAVILTFATALVAALALVLAAPDSGDAGTGDAAAQDYLRRAVEEEFMETSDPREVRRFLERELGVVVDPLQAPGLSLLRAEICLLEGVRGAMIEYRLGEDRVSQYVIPAPVSGARPPSVSQGGRGKGAAGLPAVTWAGSGLEHVLLGELPAARLLELVVAAGAA